MFGADSVPEKVDDSQPSLAYSLCREPQMRQQTTDRWWFQACFIVTPIWGNDPNLANILQMGWNRQPDYLRHGFSL